MTVYFAMTPDQDGELRPGFWLRADHAPEDAVKITAKRHRALLEAQAAGGKITADRHGKPATLKPATVDPRAQLITAVKREAARRIDRVAPAWRQMNDMREPSPEGAARFAQIDAIRAASTDIEDMIKASPSKALPDLPIATNPLWPEID